MRAPSPDAPTFRVLGDQPYCGENDPFGFAALARELKRLILASRGSTPFTIGIEASWGRGKSSLMEQLYQELAATADLPVGVEIRRVKFNAWTAEGQDVLEGLVKSVLEAMDKNALRRALRNQRLVSVVKIPLLLLAGYLRVGGLVDAAWDRLSVDARTRNQVNDLVTKAMKDWFEQTRAETSGADPNRLLVVFIDDLDRCSPENVLKIFEGLKLYLEAPGFVFVIGYDEAMVAEAVASQKQFNSASTGRDYIEKIVQIVFRIPQPKDEEVNDLLARFLADSQTADLFDDAGRKLVIERNGRNPRRIKRFVNRFILDFRLDEASEDLNAELLIKLLLLETYFPDFARLFTIASRKNPIQEFLDYAAARTSLKRSADPVPALDELFQFYDIAQGADTQASLERLEREVDEVFLRLVRDEDFLSLAHSLEDQRDQELILEKVQGRRERESSVPASEAAPASAASAVPAPLAPSELPNVQGRRILWIDDKPANSAKLIETLKGLGAQIEVAESGTTAAEILRSFTPDLLVSDVGRSGNPNAGFEDALRFRSDGLYVGPLVFYSGRISASKRELARKLNAEIVGEEPELLRAIGTLLAPTAPPVAA